MTDNSFEPRTSRRKLLVSGGILLGGLLGAAALVMSRPQPQRAATPRMAPTVQTAALEARNAPLVVEGTGTVRPTAEIGLSPEVSGRVVSMSPDLVRGGSFEAGEVLLVLEDASYRNAVAVARAEVDQRRVDLALAGQNRLIAQREYQLLQARTGRSSEPDTTLAARLARQQPQYEAAEASVARAEAQLADAELDLRRTTIRAPFAGRVRSESVDVGQIINPGQVFAQIYATGAVEVDISLSTRQAALIGGLWDDIGIGDVPATVRAEFGGVVYEWQGFVARAAGDLDPTTRTVEVVLRISDPFASDGERPPLLIGSYVRAAIEGRSVDDHFAIPRRALRDGATLWVVTDEGTLTSAEIGVIQEVQDSVYVRSDLPEGARYVVSDLAVMTEGMEIRPVAAGTSESSAPTSPGGSP